MGLLLRMKHCKACGGCIPDHTPILPQSPTPHLRRMLRPPNVIETALLEESLQNAQVTITHIDEEISKLAAIVDDLRGKRDSLHCTVVENQSFLAPIRRLPSEILENIFMLCCRSQPYSSFYRQEAPLLLTQVCAGWRDLAHSSQRLWAAFTISGYDPFNDSLAEAWLSHAKSIPLSPSLHLPSNTRSGRRMWPILSHVIQYCDRWQHLVLNMPNSILARFHSVEHRLPLLETLSMDIRHSSHSEPITAFQFAPRLRQLRLVSDVEARMIEFPWHQLTSFSGHCDNLAGCFDKLLRMPNLTNLTLRSSHTDFGPFALTIMLPHLIYLDVILRCETVALFETLQCPVLETLRLLAPGPVWESNEFIQFLFCCASIRQLSIARPELDQSNFNIIPCLEVISSLTTIILDGTYCDFPTEDILRRLTVTDTMAGGLLPALENLCVGVMFVDRALFAAMVRSRMAPDKLGMTQLRTLTLSAAYQPLHFDQESMGDICVNLERGIGLQRPWASMFV